MTVKQQTNETRVCQSDLWTANHHVHLNLLPPTRRSDSLQIWVVIFVLGHLFLWLCYLVLSQVGLPLLSSLYPGASSMLFLPITSHTLVSNFSLPHTHTRTLSLSLLSHSMAARPRSHKQRGEWLCPSVTEEHKRRK
ncbi:hypothetical protein QBC45DRAFT_159576 [Copromyces sp. CBS 386.78]|nr:hypothetical protein QBC45DRAFT_159576 [Copromyces sp. CBS 386.78]